MEAWLSSLGSAAGGLAATAGLVLCACGLGALALRATGLRLPRHPFERVLVGFALGAVLLSLGVLGCGLVRLPTAGAIRAALAAGSLATLAGAGLALRDSASLRRRLSRPRAWLGGLLFAAPVLPGAACAPVGWDDLAYHVEVPLRWWTQGHVGVLPDNPYSGLPSAVEMLFVPVLGAGGIVAPGALTVAAWLAAAGLLYRLLRRRLRPLPAYAVTLAVCWSHLGFMLAGESYAESWLALELLSLVAVLRTRASARPAREASIAGALLGGALAMKPTAGAFALMALVLAGRRALRRETVLAALVALAIATPFFLRPAWATGNPLHPYAAELFRPGDAAAVESSRHHHAIAVDRYGRRGPAGLGLALVELATEGHRYSGNLGRQWWLLLALALGAAACDRRPRRLLLAAGAGYLAWFLTAQQARFLWPSVMLLALAAGGGLALLSGRARGLLAALLAVLALLEIPAARWGQVWASTQRAFHVGAAPSRATWLHTGTGEDLLPAMQALLDHSPREARVLFVGEPRALYAPRDHAIGTPFFQAELFTPPEGLSAEEVLAQLERGGFTHVLEGRPGRDPDVEPSDAARQRLLEDRLEELVRLGRLEISWSSNSHRLFERRSGAGGMR